MVLNKNTCLLSVGIALLSLQLSAQKKQFTMAEATNGMATTLAPQNIKAPSWQPGTHTFYQLVKTGNGDAWVATTFPDGKTDTVLRTKELGDAIGAELKAMPAMQWLDKDHIYFTRDTVVRKGTIKNNNITWSQWTTIPGNAENTTVDKNGVVAYTIDNNLWMITAANRRLQVTSDAEKNIVNGQIVHRNEFGIETGIFFSPKGSYLAYYRMDQTMVEDYPIVKWNTVPAVADMVKYPMAGRKSHEVTLRVFNPATGKTVTMQTGAPKDQYLTCVTWSPDEKYIYIAILNRGQDHLWLNQYDAQTGAKLKTLFEETSDKYVHPTHALTFLPGSNDQFIWWSEKDGYQHLYLYNTDGKQIRQVTQGNWVVNELLGFNAKNNQLIITASKESPMARNVYAVNWKNGNMARIDKDAGMHAAWCSEDGTYVYDNCSSSDIVRKGIILSTDGKYSKPLLNAPDPLAAYERARVKDVQLAASDGTPLYGKLILPANFDANKKYPAIVYLYNGPNVQLLHNSYPASGNLWYEYMAQHGYIVFTMDGRGSWNRGLAFEQATFGKLGTVEMEDQMKGVDYLKSLPYVDANRMGIHGWSFGGFMTTSFMLRNPDVFKVGVAGGPVMDWSMYEVMYTERYMNTPQENAKGYEDAELISKVKNLKGKLLLIHGTSDDVVVWQHSINFIRKSVEEGVQVDYFVYPGHEHNVRGKDRVHLMQKITDYFDQNLK